MRSWLKALVVVAVTLPIAAYVVATLGASPAQPSPQSPVVLRDPPPEPVPDTSATPRPGRESRQASDEQGGRGGSEDDRRDDAQHDAQHDAQDDADDADDADDGIPPDDDDEISVVTPSPKRVGDDDDFDDGGGERDDGGDDSRSRDT